MTHSEIIKSYREAKKKNEQIQIISELALIPRSEVESILLEARELEGRGGKKIGFEDLLQLVDKTDKEIATELGISIKTVRKWRNGLEAPKDKPAEDVETLTQLLEEAQTKNKNLEAQNRELRSLNEDLEKELTYLKNRPVKPESEIVQELKETVRKLDVEMSLQLGMIKALKELNQAKKPRTYIAGSRCWNGGRMIDLKKGNRVRFINANVHKKYPNYFPEAGTIGEFKETTHLGNLVIQWPEGSTSDDDCWVVAPEFVEKEVE